MWICSVFLLRLIGWDFAAALAENELGCKKRKNPVKGNNNRRRQTVDDNGIVWLAWEFSHDEIFLKRHSCYLQNQCWYKSSFNPPSALQINSEYM